MLLIDRLNLKAKPTQIDLTFNDVEQKFFDRAMTTQTFEEVIELSKELFEYCEKELEEKQQTKKILLLTICQFSLNKAKMMNSLKAMLKMSSNGMNAAMHLMNNQKKKASLLLTRRRR